VSEGEEVEVADVPEGALGSIGNDDSEPVALEEDGNNAARIELGSFEELV